ncbi:sex comb on midleg-like protein 4 isoform X3 [Scleropages formosus]|uniref:sex comb on midleg-like protein 4 isoform X3 n=1 Tax=Scleropages formosus TaxID=113540 RepID=UPI000879153B|nr:sex comb on midleg-like protein 4 isoform X3 [Scleropages formosus]
MLEACCHDDGRGTALAARSAATEEAVSLQSSGQTGTVQTAAVEEGFAGAASSPGFLLLFLHWASDFLNGPMSIPAASMQKGEGGDMQSPVMAPSFLPGQRGKIPGRKRGRPPLRSVPKMDFPNRYSESLSPLKVPKKRGRKPGFKLKSRLAMTPLAISPPSSTPEPDMSSIPQDAATVPHSATPQVLTAETSMPEDYLADPIDSKRYSVDPSDSAFNAMGSSYPGKAYGYRSCQSFPSGRQASSPNTFQEGNRSAYSPSPESQEAKPPPSKDPSTWTVEDVVWFVKDADPQALGPHVDVFRKHEIDGYALLLLKSDVIMKYLGLKLGPALKLCYHIDKLKQAKF